MAFAKNVGIAAIVAATVSGDGFAIASKKEAEKLAGEGLVEINPDVTTQTSAGVQVRATQKGIDSVNTPTAATAPAAAAPAKVKPVYTLESGVPLPAASPRGRVAGESVYPFDQMSVGQSFFVDKLPKNLASTISAAKARYAVAVEGQSRQNKKGETVQKMRFTRNFVARAETKDGVNGTRIYRVEDVAAPAA